tara:strand:- start:119 stop:1216 length:1098 start_codon:yes stop_codon:yes gene_type:complete
MKIFIATNNYWNFVNFRKPLFEELKKKNFKLIILCNVKKEKILLKNKKIKIHNINFESNFNFFNDFCNLLMIFFYYLKYKPNVVLNFTIKPILLCSFVNKFFSSKCVNTVTGFGNLYLKSKRHEIFFEILYKLFTSKKNYFFFHNKNDYKHFIKKKISLKKKSLITMGSGVDLKYFRKLKPFIKKKIKFTMISRLIFNKGVIEFLEVVNLFRNNNNLYFELIGREVDDRLNEIKSSDLKKYKTLNNLKISNFTHNIKNKIKNTNFVVLPSYREGMPKSLMESMSSGIPVISSKVVGSLDLVIENFNGFFCLPKSKKSLYTTILKASKINKKKYNLLSNNCRKFAEKFLDEKKVVDEYLSLIKKIL